MSETRMFDRHGLIAAFGAVAADIRGPMRSLAVDAEGAMHILRRCFPNGAADGGQQRVLLRPLGRASEGESDAPRYGR